MLLQRIEKIKVLLQRIEKIEVLLQRIRRLKYYCKGSEDRSAATKDCKIEALLQKDQVIV